jgi:hypothetical protein
MQEQFNVYWTLFFEIIIVELKIKLIMKLNLFRFECGCDWEQLIRNLSRENRSDLELECKKRKLLPRTCLPVYSTISRLWSLTMD